ncbi:MAG: hypothetical protein PWQ96_577 [Clostridia bacterium]|nr:hypothetical protein [Clostridia bacterium]
MKIPNVIGYLEKDAKKILQDKGFETTSTYLDEYISKLYSKTNLYRVIRQNNSDRTVHLLLAPQCDLNLKGGGENGS